MEYQKTTSYGFISGVYFRKILKEIINLGNLYQSDKTILDFGCGSGELKKILKKSNINVVNYDLKPEYSEISDWREVKVDIFVANQVFYTFSKEELSSLLEELKELFPNLLLIIGISKQKFINRLGAFLLLQFDAHKNTRLTLDLEKKIIENYAQEIQSISVYGLTEVILYKFK